jgi:hypothetical protein
MKRRVWTMRAGGWVLLVALVLVLMGIGSKGPPVPSSTLRQIKPGRTTKNWLLSVMGEPSRAARTSANTEVLTYEYTKTVDSDFNFFIFFNSDNRREERTVHVFEVEDGIVTRHWKER